MATTTADQSLPHTHCNTMHGNAHTKKQGNDQAQDTKSMRYGQHMFLVILQQIKSESSSTYAISLQNEKNTWNMKQAQAGWINHRYRF